MSAENMYGLCQQHLNKAVEIRCQDGAIHRGVITKVDEQNVYLQPFDGAGDGLNNGPGVFAYGYGFGFPIALASIAAIAAFGLFW